MPIEVGEGAGPPEVFDTEGALPRLSSCGQHEGDLDNLSETVSRWPEVVDCYPTTGQRDYLMRIVVKDLETYERFLKEKLTPDSERRLDRDELCARTGEALGSSSPDLISG